MLSMKIWCTSPTSNSTYSLDSNDAGPRYQTKVHNHTPDLTLHRPLNSSLAGTWVWDVVNELMSLCTMLPPDNPFSLEMRYLQTLPLPERFLATGALLNFLEMIVVQGHCKKPFYDPVVEEIRSLRQLHFQSLTELLRHHFVQRRSLTKLDSAEKQQSSSNGHGSGNDHTHFEHKVTASSQKQEDIQMYRNQKVLLFYELQLRLLRRSTKISLTCKKYS